MTTWEQTVELVTEKVLADVENAVKNDEKYAPLVAKLAAKALQQLTELAE
jgi:hypothetical protein